MMSGYYGSPSFGRSREYIPQGSIAAFVNRDTIATNTYAGGPLNIPRGELPIEEHSGAESYTEKTEIQELSGHETAQDIPDGLPAHSKYKKLKNSGNICWVEGDTI